MIKSVLILLLAVGYSLQTPVEEAPSEVPAKNQENQEVPNEGELRTQSPTEEENPEVPEEPELPEIYPDGECPEADLEFPVYLSDLKNCSVFYQCAHGIPYRMTCSYPLEFNSVLKVCDFPGMSGCIIDKISPYRIIGRCPPNSAINKLLRDSEDNTIYYECVGGVPVLRKCPPDTIFSFRRVCEPVA